MNAKRILLVAGLALVMLGIAGIMTAQDKKDKGPDPAQAKKDKDPGRAQDKKDKGPDAAQDKKEKDSAREADVKAIAKLVEQQIQAFNKRDAAALPANWTAEGGDIRNAGQR